MTKIIKIKQNTHKKKKKICIKRTLSFELNILFTKLKQSTLLNKKKKRIIKGKQTLHIKNQNRFR